MSNFAFVNSGGEQYDAIQHGIRANHLSIVGKARGEPRLTIGDALRRDTAGPYDLNRPGFRYGDSALDAERERAYRDADQRDQNAWKTAGADPSRTAGRLLDPGSRCTHAPLDRSGEQDGRA